MSLGLLILVRFGESPITKWRLLSSIQQEILFLFNLILPCIRFHSVLSLVTVRFFDENYLLSLLQYGLFPREGRYADNGLCYFTYIDKVRMQSQVVC